MNASARNPCNDSPRRARSRYQNLAEKSPHKVYICLGSNIQPESNLPKAVDLLCGLVEVKAVSHAWETPPEGTKGPNFLNAMVYLETALTRTLFKSLVVRRIEIQLGRKRTQNKYAPRTIDLDLILYDDLLMEPRLWTLAYLAVPLAELNPYYKNPETQEILDSIAQRLRSQTPIHIREDVKIFQPIA